MYQHFIAIGTFIVLVVWAFHDHRSLISHKSQYVILNRALKGFKRLSLLRLNLQVHLSYNTNIKIALLLSLLCEIWCFTWVKYFYRIIKELLESLIKTTMEKKHPKLLLRRSESVVEKMLTHWLSLCLFKYLQVSQLKILPY